MRVLVTGGRTFGHTAPYLSDEEALELAIAEKRFVFDTLDKLLPRELGQGGATGADQCSYEWAIDHDVPCATYTADWRMEGKAAGILRNIQMLKDFKPDLVVAFPGGRGTAHMVSIARKAKVEVREYAPSN